MNTPPKEKWLWVMRHGEQAHDPTAVRTVGWWQPDAPLTDRGRREVARVRDTYLAGHRFTYLAHSPLLRARQTAAIAVPEGDWHELARLGPALLRQTDDLFRRLPPDRHPQTVDEIEALCPGWCARETAQILFAVLPILVKEISPGESALVVSHQPLVGFLRGRLDLAAPKHDVSLPKAGIYRFRFDTRGNLLGTDTVLPPV